MKFIRIISTVAFFVLLAMLLVSSVNKQREKKLASQNLTVLPALDYLFLPTGNNEPDILSNIHNRSVIVNIFSPDCEHCQHTAEELTTSDSIFSNDFSEIRYLMLSRADTTSLREFQKKYKLEKLKWLLIGTDNHNKMFKNFGTMQSPSFFIYNQEHHLIKKFTGETSLAIVHKLI